MHKADRTKFTSQEGKEGPLPGRESEKDLSKSLSTEFVEISGNLLLNIRDKSDLYPLIAEIDKFNSL